jgi:hypothetical protein
MVIVAWGTLTKPHLRYQLMAPFFMGSSQGICINKAFGFGRSHCESVGFEASWLRGEKRTV